MSCVRIQAKKEVAHVVLRPFETRFMPVFITFDITWRYWVSQNEVNGLDYFRKYYDLFVYWSTLFGIVLSFKKLANSVGWSILLQHIGNKHKMSRIIDCQLLALFYTGKCLVYYNRQMLVTNSNNEFRDAYRTPWTCSICRHELDQMGGPVGRVWKKFKMWVNIVWWTLWILFQGFLSFSLSIMCISFWGLCSLYEEEAVPVV